MTRAVVTGGAGFIGSHLTRHLLGKGWDVVVVDDLSTGDANRVPEGATLVEGSVLDDAVLDAAMAGADVVFHEAALPSVGRSVADPVRSFRVNAHGTLSVLEAMRRLDVPRIVYAASSSAYGDTEVLPKVESMPNLPRSPYAASKLAGEHLIHGHAHSFGITGVCLRYFNVYGPGQPASGGYPAVIPAFLAAATQGRSIRIDGDGLQSRDFTFVEDVARANLAAASASPADVQGAVTCNIGAGGRTTILDVAKGVLAETGATVAIEHGPTRAGDVKHSQADIRRARDVLGWTPQVTFDEGLRRTVAAFLGT